MGRRVSVLWLLSFLPPSLHSKPMTSGVSEGREQPIRAELRTRIREGDVLEVISPGSFGLKFTAAHLTDASGLPIGAAVVPGMSFDMDAPEDVRPGDLLRIRIA